jgi:hypothetical protein
MLLVMLFSLVSCNKTDSDRETETTPEQSNSIQNTETSEKPSTQPPEINPTLSYDYKEHLELFDSPASNYRWYTIIHDVAHRYRTGVESWKSTVNYLVKNGYGGVVMNADWNEDYLKDETVFDQLNAATDILFESGLGAWIYDEYGYPSGNAGGQTTVDHPEYVAKGLVYIKKSGNGTNPVTVVKNNNLIKLFTAYAVDSNGNVHAAKCTENEVTFNGVSGGWTLYVFAEKKLYEGTHAENSSFGGEGWICKDYLNIMDKNAVREFINNTYAVYGEKYSSFSNIGGVFTDEPSLMEKYQNTGKSFEYAQISWVDGFDYEFEAMHGYDIKTELHNLFEEDSDYSKTVRVNYRQTVAKLVSENYFGQLNDYCEENGTYLSGHCLLEEGLSLHAYYYGDLMQCLKEMGIAGVDCLTGKPDNFLSPNGSYYMAIKYASSVSRIYKDSKTMLELAPTDYANLRLSETEMDELWRVLSLQYFYGANHVNSYLSIDALSYKQKMFCNYFARLGYMSLNAKWNGGIAVYYPINTAQAYSIPSKNQSVPVPTTDPQSVISSLCLKLNQAQMDYLVVDNDFIREASIGDGTLYNDRVSFNTVCMPAVEVMPLDVFNKLKAFEESGGKVIWVGSVPTVADKLADTPELKALTSNIKSVSAQKAVSDLEDTNSPKLEIKKSTSTLFVGTYILDDAPMYWLYNNNGVKKELKISYDGALAFDIYDPKSGEITRVYGDSFEYTLEAYMTAFITVVY